MDGKNQLPDIDAAASPLALFQPAFSMRLMACMQGRRCFAAILRRSIESGRANSQSQDIHIRAINPNNRKRGIHSLLFGR